jgi:RNA polymerase II-associated factor 1
MSRSGNPHVHQDYLARVRYSNALPPPPFYPKFLEIPNTGLSSGLYTSPHYASRLAREQPLNIEADAELGMPIDLVGIQGVFEGKEEKIMFEDDPAPLHPKDRELLRPINALGKPVASSNAVSFLRRTEYISSKSAVNKGAGANPLMGKSRTPKVKPAINKDDPLTILRGIVKGFNLAYPQDTYTGEDSVAGLRGESITEPEKQAWHKPKHPTKSDLKLLDSYPVLPDLDAFPDTSNYMLIKYQTNPSDISTHYDPRLDVALIRMLDPTSEENEAHEERKALIEATDPTAPVPLQEYRYDVLILKNSGSVDAVKRKFSTSEPIDDSTDGYDKYEPESDRHAFQYKRLRQYETYQQQSHLHNEWNDSVGLMLNDGEDGERLPRGAYMYPIVQKTSIRPKRLAPKMGQLARGSQAYAEDDSVQVIHGLDVAVRGMNEEEIKRIEEKRAQYDVQPASALDTEE